MVLYTDMQVMNNLPSYRGQFSVHEEQFHQEEQHDVHASKARLVRLL